MKEELNIAAILKKKPNAKLWSPIFGGCRFEGIRHTTDKLVHKLVVSTIILDTIYTFDTDGRYVVSGEVCLFPSRYMRDWSKFAWKKGDVLYCGVDNICIFNKWENDEYTEFNAEFATPNYRSAVLKTIDWTKVTNEDTIKQYISKIEEVKGGKLNLSTLEIEKPKQEFKDGDIVTLHGKGCDTTFIFSRWKTEDSFYYYAFHTCGTNYTGLMDSRIILPYEWTYVNGKLNIATDSEKQQLFDALEKENKKWNPTTKQIEDLPKKCDFEPFQKILVRNSKDCAWKADLFSHYDKQCNKPYCCVGNIWMEHCIPYNEETKHLLGTTDEWKGGEEGK